MHTRALGDGDATFPTSKSKSALRFETLNIRTLYKPGAILSLVKEFDKYRLGILVIQEVRWNEKGAMEIENSVIFFGQYDNRRQGGTGFVVKKNIVPFILFFLFI